MAGAGVGATLLLGGPTTTVWLVRGGGWGDVEASLDASLERIGR